VYSYAGAWSLGRAGHGGIVRYYLSAPKGTVMTDVVRPVAIKIDATTKERVKRLADARQRTSHWLMREAIQQYVEREEKREAYRQAGIKAWQEYRRTGLHATSAEVEAWLASWGTDGELPAPACHK
jgi:predicted transcriptional regulator